jgi:hypothetical protein
MNESGLNVVEKVSLTWGGGGFRIGRLQRDEVYDVHVQMSEDGAWNSYGTPSGITIHKKNDGHMNEVSSSIQHRLESHFPVIAGFITQLASLLTKPHLQALDILGFTCVSTSTVCLRLYTLPKCLTSCVALAQYSQPPLIFL